MNSSADVTRNGRSPIDTSLLSVTVVMADPRLRKLQAILVATFRNNVEVVIGGVENIDPARPRRVRVKDAAVLVFVEDADAFAVGETGFRGSEVVQRCAALDFSRVER